MAQLKQDASWALYILQLSQLLMWGTAILDFVVRVGEVLFS